MLHKKVGVLGGGQLGRMFMGPAINFGVDTWIIDPDENAPCKDVATHFQVGDIRDEETVYQFGQQVDVLTIEIENVNIEALRRLESEGKKIYPQSQVIDIIKDKRKQKAFYKAHDIPTSEFVLTESKSDLKNYIDFLPAFQKLGTGGYDGGGVQRLNTEEDLENGFDEPGLLEKLVAYEKELSVIVSRNPNGELRAFPLVELVYHPAYNLVDYLLSPAQVDPEVEKKAIEVAKQVITALDMVGILAVELFLTTSGEILVNEVAPRPHNSGHQTIHANHTSQYEQHLRSILNLPLGDTGIKIPSAMVNLIGEEGFEGLAIYEGIEKLLEIPGVNLVLYGKKLTKPHRKMGHVTITDENIDRLKEKVELVKKTIKIIA